METHERTVSEPEQENRLVHSWVAGNPAAGEILLSLLLPGIYGLCRRILQNQADAEDATQEAFLRLCRHVGKGRALDDVRKWMVTVAMNLCFDRRRQKVKELPVPLVEEGGTQSAVPESEPVDTADLDRIRRGMESLPERYRLVLEHHFVLKLKPRQIADVMGLEPGTARVLLHRAISALRKQVQE